jgi:methylenetetrahydrofolate reductase (NADPH)
MKFEDEPVPGYPLPILPGHTSPGRLERVLRAGAFAVTSELDPPDSADPEDVYRRARIFDGYVDAINATDGSGANCHMSSLAVCALLTRIGYAPVMQISCRDKNRIAIQGDILGGAAMGVANMLCLSGDGVQSGDHPQAKPVFDLDCMSCWKSAAPCATTTSSRAGARSLLRRACFLVLPPIRSGCPLNGVPSDWPRKIAAGAQFMQTQYCYDVPRLKKLHAASGGPGPAGGGARFSSCRRRSAAFTAKAADWMRTNVPGIHIPDAVIKRMAGAEKPALEGRQICIDLIQEIREIKGVSGVHVMAYRQEESVAEIIERSGVLKGRVPWYPGRDRNFNRKQRKQRDRYRHQLRHQRSCDRL